jgi:hypothetical protein
MDYWRKAVSSISMLLFFCLLYSLPVVPSMQREEKREEKKTRRACLLLTGLGCSGRQGRLLG